MHQVQVPMVELNRCTEKRKNKKIKVGRQQMEKWLSKELSYTLHKPFARDFLEIRQLYFMSMNYDRWICAIRVA